MPKMWVITRETTVDFYDYEPGSKKKKEGSFDDRKAAKKAIKDDGEYDASVDIIVTLEE